MTDEAKKQAKKLLTFGKDKDLALFDEIQELNTNIKALVDKEVPKMPPYPEPMPYPEMPTKMKVELEGAEFLTIKGEKGEPGEQGEIGLTGADGKDGINGKDGKDGANGLDGRDGVDGRDGKDGVDGKDGSPDTGEQIIEKINGSEAQIDRERIKGLEEAVREFAPSRFGGGGNSLTLKDEGTVLTKNAREINFVGSGVALTNIAGVPTVTIPGGSGGITRAITVTSGSATMGATASTDYVYLVAGAHTMTLPTAVGNTNRYTVKNNHSANITIDTTASQTIDGTTTISIQPEDAVDIISDNSNWFII